MEIRYEDLADRLTDEAAALFREMVGAHLDAGSGDRRFMLTEYMGGNSLSFVSPGSRHQGWQNIDPGALQDLASYGLLRVGFGGRGTPNYRVTGEGLAFYRWWMRQLGRPMEQAETVVRRNVASDSFARAHPGAAHHLSEAFDLLWTDGLDDQTVSEIGDHLRKALMDTVQDVVSDEGGPVERPDRSLEAWLSTVNIGDRERDVVAAIVELARVTLRLDHRLNHIRDEVQGNRRAATQAELQRAAFATVMACDQISALSELR